MQQANAKEVMDGSVTADRSLMVVLFVLGGVAVALGVVCAAVITRSITGPLSGAVAWRRKWRPAS
jgi:methyl-accepting chemotaxis protein